MRADTWGRGIANVVYLAWAQIDRLDKAAPLSQNSPVWHDMLRVGW